MNQRTVNNSPAYHLLDKVEWKKLPALVRPVPGLFATHSGVFAIGSIQLRCYQLSDGQRVFDAADVAHFFDPEARV